MVVQDFRDLLAKRPFEPFCVVMSSGERYEVRHPEMAFLSRTTLYVGLEIEDGIPARHKMCSLLHVATVEPLDSTANA
ncbi:MAG: hypothetical protein AAF710_01730 [Planctomycetota bacterium]